MTLALLGFAAILLGTASVYLSEKMGAGAGSKFEIAGGLLLVGGCALIGSRLSLCFT